MESKGNTVTVARVVKLTPAQKLAIVAAANQGGRLFHPDYGVRVTLQSLKLIEERPALSVAETRDRKKKIAAGWRDLAALVKKKDVRAAETKIDEIRGWVRDLEPANKAWFLTPAANEYLGKGTVTIQL